MNSLKMKPKNIFSIQNLKFFGNQPSFGCGLLGALIRYDVANSRTRRV